MKSRGKLLINHEEKGNSFFLPKSNTYVSVNFSKIFYNQFPGSTLSCPQNLGPDLPIISEEAEALGKMINQSIQCITRDLSQQSVSIETQTRDVSSTEYVDFGVGTNDDLFVMVANKGTDNYLIVKG